VVEERAGEALHGSGAHAAENKLVQVGERINAICRFQKLVALEPRWRMNPTNKIGTIGYKNLLGTPPHQPRSTKEETWTGSRWQRMTKTIMDVTSVEDHSKSLKNLPQKLSSGLTTSEVR